MIKALLAVLVALLLAGCSDDPTPPDDAGTPPSSETSEGPTTTKAPAPDETEAVLEVRDGKLESGPAGIEVDRGAVVVLKVSTDAPDELHVHGYDKTAKLDPSKPTVLRFTADLPGVWEIELHHSGTVVFELTVNG